MTHRDLQIEATVDDDDDSDDNDGDGDDVDNDKYNAASGDDGDGVDAFHLVTRTNTSLGLQVADQPLGVVHQLRLDSREIKKAPFKKIKKNKKMPFFKHL